MKESFQLTEGPVLSLATKDPLTHKKTRIKRNLLLSALLSLDWQKLFFIITEQEQM